ncbi:MAG TPA: hypothetical protein VL199_15435, partial [Burkholderiales bacterium]|nr:hypothetical protein [Burkholderiales bacterium]
MRALCALVLALALPVAAQVPAEQPKKLENPPERRPLNLRLDNASSFATTAPEKEPARDLPTLGGDARRINPGGANATSRDPIPKDSNPG